MISLVKYRFHDITAAALETCSSLPINHHPCHTARSIKRLIEGYCYHALGTFFDKETTPAALHSVRPSTVRFNSLPIPIQVERLGIKRTGCYEASRWLPHWMAHWHTSQAGWMIPTTQDVWMMMGRCTLGPLHCWLDGSLSYFLFFLTMVN